MWIGSFLTASQNTKQPSHSNEYDENKVLVKCLSRIWQWRGRELRNLKRLLCKDCRWINLVLLQGFSLKILSRSSVSFVGIRGIYILGWERNVKRQVFSKQGWLAAWPRDLTKSRDPVARYRMASCPILSCSAPASMTVHLLACLTRVLHLAACSRESPARSNRESLFSCTLLSNQHSISLTTLTTKPT